MTEPEGATTEYPKLSVPAQAGAIAVGLTILVAAGFLYFFPPSRVSNETAISAEPKTSSAKRSDQPAEPSTIVIAMLTAGVATLVYGINGFRVTKLSSPIVDAESGKFEKKRAEKQSVSEAPAPNIPPQAPGGGGDEIQKAQQAVLLEFMRYFLGASSWNGIKICFACRLAFGTQSKQFSLRNLCALDARMGFDYAFGCLVATSSTAVFKHYTDSTNTLITVTEFNAFFGTELDAEIQRRIAADLHDAPTKQAEMGTIRRFFGATG